MSELVTGTVINVHAFGAAVRLKDGRLSVAPQNDVEAHRSLYNQSLSSRRPIDFVVEVEDGHCKATVAPQIHDDRLEDQIARYLKMTEEWEKPDAPPAHERHFLRKKRRAALFESRHAPDR